MITIIGSGPAGYTAAIYAARGGRNPVLIASAVNAGGALVNTTEIENYPGFAEHLLGPDLMEKMRLQAEKFGTKIIYQDAVDLDLEGKTKKVYLSSGDVVESAALIIATGTEYRNLGLADEKRLSGKGVSWCATCDGFFFRDKVTAVVGGGDSAMEEALFLTKFASKVYVIHRSNTLRASKIMQERALSNSKIEFIWDTQVTTLHGKEVLTGVTLLNKQGATQQIELQGLFIAIGSDPRVELVKEKLALTTEGYIMVKGRSSHTSLSGVFAAGDVIDPTYRQAVVAAGSGATAAIDAELYLVEHYS